MHDVSAYSKTSSAYIIPQDKFGIKFCRYTAVRQKYLFYAFVCTTYKFHMNLAS